MSVRAWFFQYQPFVQGGVIMKNTHYHEDKPTKHYFVKKHSFAVVRSKNHLLDTIDCLSKGAIAFAVIKSKPTRMGEIVEISRKGLSFEYIDNEKLCSNHAEMDILVVDDNFHLSRVPFKLVQETLVEADIPFNSLQMKRMTVQFNELSFHQKRKLNHFLERYTFGAES